MEGFLKNELYDIYRDKLVFRLGSSDCKIKFDIKNLKFDIAIYCNKTYKIAVVWNIKYRVQSCWKGTNLSYNKSWSDIVVSDGGLDCDYKYFHTPLGPTYEKVLIVSFDVLDKIKYDLYEYLKFDTKDDGVPISELDKDPSLWTNNKNRERISTATWKRNYKFRKAILENYNHQCAICGCGEDKILEAAHIVAVKDGGSDNVENGICLCRNHHKMFDEKMFKLQFDTHIITDISESVKKFINDDKTFSKGNHEKTK